MTRPLHGIFALLHVTLVWGTIFPAKVMEVRSRRATRLLTVTAAQIGTVALCAALCLLAREVPGEALTARGWLGGLLLISGMIVSQWNFERRPAAALAPE